MFYNYLKLIYSFIKNKDRIKIQKINKINNLFINQFGGDILDEKLPEFRAFEEIFGEFISNLENLKQNKQFNEEEINKIKKSLELLKQILSEIENISDEDINNLKESLKQINEILEKFIDENKT